MRGRPNRAPIHRPTRARQTPTVLASQTLQAPTATCSAPLPFGSFPIHLRKDPHAPALSDEHTARPLIPLTRRKRLIATASCVVLGCASGAGWSSLRVPTDLTALDAWNRYMDLVKDGSEAQRYSEKASLFDEDSRELPDGCRTRAPSKVLRGAHSPKTRRRSRAGSLQRQPRSDATTSMRFKETKQEERSARHVEDQHLFVWFDDHVDRARTGLRSIRVGIVMVSNPQGFHLLLQQLRMEATPRTATGRSAQAPWSMVRGNRTNATRAAIEPSGFHWTQTSEAFAASCHFFLCRSRATTHLRASHSPLNHWTW